MSPRHSEAEKSVKRVAPVLDWYCALGYSVSFADRQRHFLGV